MADEERRVSDLVSDQGTKRFLQRLTYVLIFVSALGAGLVLIDPKGTMTIMGTTWAFGGNGFSDQLKGAIVMLIIVAGFSSVVGFWFGASNQGTKAQDSVASIAAAAAPAQLAAVNAAVTAATGIPPATPATPGAVVTPAAPLPDGTVPAAAAQEIAPKP